ncbi:hypothetical protein M8J77_017316 [Diaphorina citri]|nr:hypothetical protein M8J77_017316 [Diaphorina citri]
MMQFSDLFSKSRVSYVARGGYNKTPNVSNGPKVDNLCLPKTCALVLPFDASITMDAYLCAIGDIAGDDRLIFAGKCNDKFKFYLATEQDALTFYERHPQVVINNKPLTVMKLVNNGHRIFLCGTEPCMSPSFLANELSKYTKVLSDIKFVTLGSRNARFGDVLGFRRDCFVDDVTDLPPFINVHFDNTNYKIFIIIDKVKCFKCQGEGHLVKNCPSNFSAQDRLASVPASSSQPPPPLVDPVVNNFLPTFANRTAVGASTPLNVEVVSLTPESMSTPPPVISFPPPSPPAGISGAAPSDAPVVPDPALSSSVTVVESHVPPASAVDDPSPPADDTPVPAEVASDKVPELVPDTDSVMECDTPRNVGKKRGNSSSPVNDKIDKKVCVDPNLDIKFLAPVLTQIEPSLDPDVFFNLIDDLRSQTTKKKIDIIKSNFNMDPKFFTSLLEKLVLEQILSPHTKIKNRFKNLIKVLNSAIQDTSPATSQS